MFSFGVTRQMQDAMSLGYAMLENEVAGAAGKGGHGNALVGTTIRGV